MKIILTLIFFTTFKTYHCQDIKEIFEKVNKKVLEFNAIAADLAWESSVSPGNPNLVYKSAIYQRDNLEWQQKACDELERLQDHHLFNKTQRRQRYLLCRGPKYTYDEARLIRDLYEKLQTIYSAAEVCIPTEDYTSPTNLTQTETVISKYLNSGKRFLKRYHGQDPTMILAKNAISDTADENKGICLEREHDFQNLMGFSRNEEVLKWLWVVWREKLGPPMKEPYLQLVEVENVAARRNGYKDIGASWRDEQETPALRQTCRRLYNAIKPLYTLLHGVVRFYLRRQYGDVVPETGAIPAHLLGDLWSQNWEPIADLIVPKTVNLDESIAKLNWTVLHMVKRAEDFYQSLGLPPMTDSFWSKSVFSRDSNKTRCHGAAADMFRSEDFRLIYCSGTTKEDFYVLHHELGHIQYYMAYEHQPALFRTANTALHESIGDTIMIGAMTPQHLHRLGLINDSLLYSTNTLSINEPYNPDHKNQNTFASDNNDSNNKLKGQNKFVSDTEKFRKLKENAGRDDFYPEDDLNVTTDEILLLKQALNRIPQIPFSLLIDEYRWKYFEGVFKSVDSNKRFWQLALELQGIAPPVKRGVSDFDIGAKFHVPDNTPYIRYFLSSFLQHQLFESLCEAAVFGRRGVKDPLPDTITMNRCDIYGSKSAGKLLKDIMSRGHSQYWRQILQETTGQDNISASALKRYYRPLYAVLEKLVRLHRIPIGW